MATGVTVAPHPDEEAWHRAAVAWWMSLSMPPAIPRRLTTRRPANAGDVPVLSSDEGDMQLPPRGTSRVRVCRCTPGRDSLTVRAEAAGWAWLRVPWDPDWRFS